MAQFRLFDAEGRLDLDDRPLQRKLRGAAQAVRARMREIDSMRAEADIEADIHDVEEKYKRAVAMAERWDKKKATAEFKADVDTASRMIGRAQSQMDRLDKQRVTLHVELSQASKATNKILNMMLGNLRKARQESEQTIPIFQRMGNALHNVRLTMGPVSLSARGMVVAFSALAPIVIHLAGALTSIVSILGTGLVGALGLGAAGLMAFGLAAGGVGGVLAAHKDIFKRYKDDLKDLGKEWRLATRETRKPIAEGIEEGLEAASDLMPLFARHSVEATKIAGDAWQGFLNRIRGDRMRGGIDTIFTNANASLRPFLDGISRLSEVATLVMASFSRHLPGISRNFEGWTQDLLEAVSQTDKLDRGVDKLVHHAKLAGSAFMETLRAIRDIANVASGEGEGALEAWAGWMKDIQKWAKSTDAEEFFDRAAEGAQDVLEAVEPIASFIGKWAKATEPFLESFLALVEGAGEFLNFIVDITGGSEGLIRVLAGLYIIKRAVGWARELAAALGLAQAAGGLGTLLGRGRGGGRGGVLTGPGGRAGGGAGGGTRPPGGVLPFPAGGTTTGNAAAKAAGASRGKAFLQGARGALSKAGPYLKAGGISAAASMLLFPEDTGGADQDAAVAAATRRAKAVVSAFARTISGSPEMRRATREIMGGFTGQPGDFKRIGAGIEELARSAQGRRIIMKVGIEGDYEVKRKLSLLMKTRLGRKVLQIAEQGGPQAWNQLRRLANTRLGRKLLEIIQRGGPQAQTILKAIQNEKLRRKLLEIAERGGTNVRGVIRAIQRDKLGNKLTILRARDEASGILGSVKAFVDSIPSFKTITIAAKAIGAAASRFSGFAEGRDPREPGVTVPDRVVRQAAKNDPLKPGGGMVDRPRFIGPAAIGGEERLHPEFVIATNPQYRERNLDFLQQAAKALGLRGFKKGKGPKEAEFKKKPEKRQPEHLTYSHAPYSAQQVGGLENKVTWWANKVEDARKGYDIEVRRFGIETAHTDIWNEDGTINNAEIQRRISMIHGLIAKLREILSLMTSLENEVNKAWTKAKLVISALEGWNPLKEGAKNRRKVLLDNARDAFARLDERKRDLPFEKESTRLDIQEWEGEISAMKGIKPQEGAGGAGGGAGGGAPTFVEQVGVLNAARETLWKTLAGGMAPTGAAGSIASIMGSSGGTIASAQPGVGGTGAGAGTAPRTKHGANTKLMGGADILKQAAGRGGTVIEQVNIEQNYQAPPPDPHTYSKGLKWELGGVG